MHPDVSAALALLHSLKPGDPVILTSLPGGQQHGTAEEPLRVQVFGAGRADGAYGSPESYGVTVGYGPGRWNVKVDASTLGGYGPIKAGKHVGRPPYRLERVSEPPAADPYDLTAAQLAETLRDFLTGEDVVPLDNNDDGEGTLSVVVTPVGHVLGVDVIRPDQTVARTYRITVERL